MCERYDRIFKVNNEERRGEVYLSRLWTDKPVKLKGETLNQIKQGGEKGKKEGKGRRRRATNRRGSVKGPELGE